MAYNPNNPNGQATMVNSAPVVIASNQSAVPVSGTLTANIGTTNGLALDATLTGGTQQTKITDGTNIATVKAASTAAVATDKALVVAISPDNSVAVTGTFWQATQPVSGTVTANIGTTNGLALDATLTGGTARAKITDGTNNAAVKAASTAAVAADPALVVAISPNTAAITKYDQVAVTTQSIAATGAQTAINVTNYNTIAVAFHGTYGASTVNFEASVDGTNYVPIMGNQISALGQGIAATLSANSSVGYVFNVSGFTKFRLNVASIASGTLVADIIPSAATTVNPSMWVLANQNGTWNIGTLTSITNTVTVSGTVTANIGTSGSLALDATLTGGTQQTKITDGTNVATVKAASTAAVATDKAVVVAISPNNTVAVTESGTWNVGLNAGTNKIGTVSLVPQTTGGLTPYKLISAASTNATSVKASAGQIYNVQAFNLNASIRYLKIYDKASAPTVGTDTPKKVYMIPGNASGAGLVIEIGNGENFANGIAFALTTGIADSDTGAVAANEIIVNLDYI